MSTPLPNLEHELEVDTLGIENSMSLSNVLCLEKDQPSTPNPINLEEDVHDLYLDDTQ